MKAGLILACVIVGVLAFQFMFAREAAKEARREEEASRTAAQEATGAHGAVPPAPTPVSVTAGKATPPEGTPAAAAAVPSTPGTEAAAKPAADAPAKPKKKKRKKTEGDDEGFFTIPHDPFPLPADIGHDHPVRSAAMRSMTSRVELSEATLSSAVAEVNGETLSYQDLLRACICRYGEQDISGQIWERVLLAELKGRRETAAKEGQQFDVTDAEIAAGEERILKENGKTRDEMLALARVTPEYWRYQVYLNVLAEKMFMEDNDVEDRKDVHPMFLSIWAQNLSQRYSSVSRFGEGGERLPAGVFAKVGEATVTTLDLAPFVVTGLTRPRKERALDDLIDQTLARQEFRAKGITVTEEDVIARIEAERAKYAGDLFPYEAFLPFMDTTLPLEVEKHRIWLGLQKLLGAPSDEEIRAHFERFCAFFGSGTASASLITALAVDPVTELESSPDAWEKALDRIQKPLAELVSGGDFNSLVMRFSEDGPEIKKWGTSERSQERVAGYIGTFVGRKPRSDVDPAIAALTFLLRQDEWAGPIRTSRGYHLVRAVETKKPNPVGLDPEPFTDQNGNGRYDWPEPLVLDHNQNGMYDEGDTFTDQNGNGKWDPGEPYEDLNQNGRYDPADQFHDQNGNGKWDGGEPYEDVIPNGHYDIGYRDQVVDDFQEDRARAFLDGLRARAKLERRLL
jgi:hypothetical protein